MKKAYDEIYEMAEELRSLQGRSLQGFSIPPTPWCAVKIAVWGREDQIKNMVCKAWPGRVIVVHVPSELELLANASDPAEIPPWERNRGNDK